MQLRVVEIDRDRRRPRDTMVHAEIVAKRRLSANVSVICILRPTGRGHAADNLAPRWAARRDEADIRGRNRSAGRETVTGIVLRPPIERRARFVVRVRRVVPRRAAVDRVAAVVVELVVADVEHQLRLEHDVAAERERLKGLSRSGDGAEDDNADGRLVGGLGRLLLRVVVRERERVFSQLLLQLDRLAVHVIGGSKQIR